MPLTFYIYLIPLGTAFCVDFGAILLHGTIVSLTFVLVTHVTNVAEHSTERNYAKSHYDNILGISYI